MMFSSNCTANELTRRVQDELGYANSPDRSFFYGVLNDCLARLYTEVIAEKRRLTANAKNGKANLAAVTPPENCAPIREQDVCAAWNGDRQLRFLPSSMFSLGGKGYYTVEDGCLCLGDPEDGETLEIAVILRPLPFGEENGNTPIPFPDEFISLLACRMRGEALRLSGEDGEAAKWLGEYNALLDEFKLWLAAVRAGRKG